MSASAVVLLSAVIIGIVALYLGTRDHWNWTRLTRRVILVLMLLVGGVAGWIYWSSRPPTSPVSEFWGISLGASKGDVLFLKGEPSEIIESGAWLYAPDRSRTYHLLFGNEDEIIRLLVDSERGFGGAASLFGIRTGFDSQRLVERLGEPTRVVRLSNDLRRAYLYAHLNSLFILRRGEVVSYGIYDVEAGDPYAEGGDEGDTAAHR